jgi:hypothetical protein
MAINEIFKTNAPTSTAPGVESAMNFARRQARGVDPRDLPKAEFWLNIGYEVDATYQDPETGEKRVVKQFISLPKGVPLDIQEHQSTSSSNEGYAFINGAKNSLIDQLKELANTMEAGQAKTLTLSVELRRVNKPQESAAKAGSNPFIKPLALVAE